MNGWLVWIENRINDLLVLLERIADAAERVADASEQNADRDVCETCGCPINPDPKEDE
jgi:hypothetical protein